MDKATRARLQLVSQQPTPSNRRQFLIDDNGFLYVDLLPDGRKLWVARWFGIKGTYRRFQKTLGSFAALSYGQASRLEDAARFAA